MIIEKEFMFDPSLVLYIPLWLHDGSVFTAGRHLCTVTGAIWTPQGRIVDAVDDYILVPAAASINNLTESTFWCWIKVTAPVANDLLFDKNLYSLSFASASTLDGLRYYSTTNARSITTTAPAANVWTFVVMTFSETGDRKLHIYLDLIEAAYSTHIASAGTISSESANDLKLFGNGGTQGVNGIPGEVGLYNRVLTAAERQRIYLATKWRYK